MIPALILLLAAAPTMDEAHRLAAKSFAEAEAAFARRDFTAAAAAFEQAARLVPHPSPWLNAAEAWERAGELVRAAEDLDQVLAMPDVATQIQTEAESRLTRMEPKLALLEVRGPRTMMVAIDSGTDGYIPARRRLLPGKHSMRVIDLTLSSSGRTEELSLRPGEIRIVDLAAQKAAGDPLRSSNGEPADPPGMATEVNEGPSTLGTIPTASWVATGVGVAAAAVGGAFGALTLGAQKRYEGSSTQAIADEFYLDKTVTNAAWITAGASLAAAIVIWIVAPDTE